MSKRSWEGPDGICSIGSVLPVWARSGNSRRLRAKATGL
nr:MAG TPA: hypothetical protein [Bacteriophage sp.]